MGLHLVAPCRHAYHSWCVVTHLSNSLKCLLKGCEEEMDYDWWALSGIKKPCYDELRRTLVIDWIRAGVPTLDNLDGQFTFNHFEFNMNLFCFYNLALFKCLNFCWVDFTSDICLYSLSYACTF